jgi:phosphoglycolate phosphatase
MMNGAARKVDGIVFDKDGTLFDFHATWSVWAADTIRELACGEALVMARIAEAIDYDLEASAFRPTSPVIAGTNREAAECVASALPGRSTDEIEQFLTITSAKAPLAPAVPLAPYLADLAVRGLALGVITNDSEHGARSHLQSAGIAARFGFVAGFDSGHGAKPEPGPLLAFAKAMGLAPERCVMVGDSTHDLMAGRRVGMQTLGVLTGMAGEAELAPLADMVLPDIGHIPAWLTP